MATRMLKTAPALLGKTFKTATLGGGYGALANNADTLRGFVMQDPALLEKIGGEKALNDYIKQHQQAGMWNPETSGEFNFSDETRKIDELLAGYQMNSVGHAGKDDGRAKAIVKDGQTLYAGDAYSYKPAKDTLDTVLKGAALIGGAYGAFSPGGMLSGLGGAAGETAAAAGAGTIPSTNMALIESGLGKPGTVLRRPARAGCWVPAVLRRVPSRPSLAWPATAPRRRLCSAAAATARE